MVAGVQALYLFCPLIVASGISAVVIRFDLLSALRRPIDGGRTIRGRRVFGNSKTWRGVAVAVAGCVLTVGLQKYLRVEALDRIALVDYRRVNPLIFGAAMGAGAMLGELPNSFVKRRLGIAPGGTRPGIRGVVLYLWDQLDLLTTAWPSVCFWVHPTPAVVVMSAALGLCLHPAISLVGYLVGARETAR
ncbi:MAG TPA: CDP-archaeol synthase [Polyangiaceae bacterium]